MGRDLTGGMDPSKDYFLAKVPADPEFRESASFWVSDDEGRIGLPRVGIEAVAGSWDQRGMQVNLGFPDGRTIVVRTAGHGRSPVDADGICRRFAAGGLEFRCLEPFKRWAMSYEGPATDTTSAALTQGPVDGPDIALRFEVEVTCALPPWVSGTLSEDAKKLFDEGFAGAFISPRYEQLCTAQGSVRAGEEEWSFTGTALRVHRQGPRDVGGFWGHCWPSALFPSGRGFGGLTFPERPGQPTFNEGFVFRGERMVPATLVDPPWIREMLANGEDVSVTLRTAEGDVHIEGEVVLSAWLAPGLNPEFPMALQQAGVRYTWDGETTYGMMERSIPGDQLKHQGD